MSTVVVIGVGRNGLEICELTGSTEDSRRS
jgi:hypothetical protein